MDSKTLSLTPQIDRSKSNVFSSAINNPITFILGQFHNPSKLLRVFTYPVPVSFPCPRSVVAGAEMLAVIVLIIALSPIWVPAVVLSVLALGFFLVLGFGAIVAAAWLPRRFSPTHKPRPLALETPFVKTKSM